MIAQHGRLLWITAFCLEAPIIKPRTQSITHELLLHLLPHDTLPFSVSIVPVIIMSV